MNTIEFHGQKSLAGYSPWGHKESDTTEQLYNKYLHIVFFIYKYIVLVYHLC